DSTVGTIFKITPAGMVTVLYSFGAGTGAHPLAALIQAGDGNFYGTTTDGGGLSTTCAGACGTVFKMTPDGSTVTVLHAFSGGADGAESEAALIQAADGDFYGTTSAGGGAANCVGPFDAGCGTVFKM